MSGHFEDRSIGYVIYVDYHDGDGRMTHQHVTDKDSLIAYMTNHLRREEYREVIGLDQTIALGEIKRACVIVHQQLGIEYYWRELRAKTFIADTITIIKESL